MLDELLELFDRDGPRDDARPRERRRGIRGLLDRLSSNGEDEDESRETPRDGRRRDDADFGID